MTNENNQQEGKSEHQQDSSDLSTMTIEHLDEFITLSKYRPLTEKELQRGKTYLRIYGTQEPMPWSTIYTRLSSGQPIAQVIKQYGHGRKISLWAQKDGVTRDKEVSEVLDKGVEARQAIQHIAAKDPDTAKTLLQRMNELTPDFQGNVAIFADKVVRKAIAKLDDKYLEPSDMEKLANAVQKSTDIIGVTQRHASGININNTEVKVQGFDFVLDAPPQPQPQQDEQQQQTIDVEATDG
jgi:hypothetical protein